MFERFKKPCCIEFYEAYDSILKNMDFHVQFFFFFKTKFEKIQSIEYAHKIVIESFIEFIRIKIFDPQIIPPEEVKKRSFLSKKIFDFCYRNFFNVSSTPSNPSELNNSLFKSKLTCLKLFKNVNQCLHSNDFSSVNKELLQHLIEQFTFVRTFSSFIYSYKKAEPIEFFKRFFFIYTFDRKDTLLDCNKEWIDNHSLKYEIIKNYIRSSARDLRNARKWFIEQLDKVDFAELSEKNKSIFFKEMFVTFGNFSNEKTGDAKGFRIPLNNIFYLGRYYNVHLFPLHYVKKERNTLELIAHETWRRDCNLKLTSKEEIEEAKRKNKSDKMCEPSEKELYGNKAPKVGFGRLMTMFSNPSPVEQGENFESLIKKILFALDIFRIPNIKSAEEVPEFVADTLALLGVKEDATKPISNLSNLIIPKISTAKEIPKLVTAIFDSMSEKGEISADYRERLKNNFLHPKSNFLKMIGSASFPLSAALSIQKSGVGLLTHYDMHKPQTFFEEMQTMVEKIFQKLV